MLRHRAPALGLVGGALAVAGWTNAMFWVISDEFAVAFAEEAALRDQIADASTTRRRGCWSSCWRSS